MGLRFPIRIQSTPAPGTVLQASDFIYEGALRVPIGADVAGAYGSLGGRIMPGGDTHLFIWGLPGSGAPGATVYEIDVTGKTPNPVYTSADRADLVTAWGNICETAQLSWTNNACGTPLDLDFFKSINQSLFWDDSQDVLIWSWNVNYTDQSLWSVGLTTLDNPSGPTFTTYGPFKFSATDQWGNVWTGGRSQFIFKHPTSGKMLMGGVSKSGNANISFGPSTFEWDAFPTTASPSGCPQTAVASTAEYLNYYCPDTTGVNSFDLTTGASSGPIQQFQYSANPALTYVFETFPTDFAPITKVNPLTNGGIGTWSDESSGVNGGIWLKGDNKEGVLYVGTIQAGYGDDTGDCTDTTHAWYRNAGVGHDLCMHGCSCVQCATGPSTTLSKGVFIIYDPATLNAVKAGATDYEAAASSLIDVQLEYGCTLAPQDKLQANNLNGVFWNPTTKKLYVGANMADAAGGYTMLIHVFSIPGI